jgi:hypothetical protein
MKTPQMAGMGVAVLIVLGVDLPIDWLCALAVFGGGVATYLASYFLKATR